MIGDIFGSDGLIVLMVAIVVLFGGSQLPKLAKNVGAAGHEFRKAQREAEAGHIKDATAVPVATVMPNMAIAPLTTPAPEDRLVVSRSELRPELAKLIGRAGQGAGQFRAEVMSITSEPGHAVARTSEARSAPPTS